MRLRNGVFWLAGSAVALGLEIVGKKLKNNRQGTTACAFSDPLKKGSSTKKIETTKITK